MKTVPGLLLTSMSNARRQTDRHLNLLKREVLYFHDPSGKVKISFRRKLEAAARAGAGEVREYAQIWERNVGTACLGKGWRQTGRCSTVHWRRFSEPMRGRPMEREELECQEENLDNMEISFSNETQLTLQILIKTQN